MLGFGNFEGFNAGVYIPYGKMHFYSGYGTDLNIYSQGFYHNIYLGAGHSVLQKWKPAAKKLSMDLRISVWNIENPSNIFSALSFIPEIHYLMPLGDEFKVEFYAGFAYSTVFRYKRKGYYNVGWPDEWMPNAGINFQYLIQ